MRFCEHLPPGCPPLDASSPKIEVYCLVDGDPPTEEDFRSLKERRPNQPFNFDHDPTLVCQACGLSVYTDVKGVELAKQVSRSLQKKKIAKGVLSEETGKIKNTPSQNTGDTHHTWWPNRDIKICVLFNTLSQNL
jgi:hypothetical protein